MLSIPFAASFDARPQILFLRNQINVILALMVVEHKINRSADKPTLLGGYSSECVFEWKNQTIQSERNLPLMRDKVNELGQRSLTSCAHLKAFTSCKRPMLASGRYRLCMEQIEPP